MSVAEEIAKIKKVVREVEDPAAAQALRSIYKALETLLRDIQEMK